LSPRAAWRLESFGFENVCDYAAGKQDWLANGLPIEGELAEAPSIGQLACREVPTCKLDEKISDVAERLQSSKWSECVVTNQAGIVLGLLRKAMWEGVDNGVLVEQTMEPGPATFRPHVRGDEMLAYLQTKKLKSALVTTSQGELVGLVRRKDLRQIENGKLKMEN
jgi:predicted transcriptional regulator